MRSQYETVDPVCSDSFFCAFIIPELSGNGKLSSNRGEFPRLTGEPPCDLDEELPIIFPRRPIKERFTSATALSPPLSGELCAESAGGRFSWPEVLSVRAPWELL